MNKLSRTSRTKQNQDKRLDTKREKRQEKGNTSSTYASIIGVVHLDWNEDAHNYLYKKVEVCMQARKVLESSSVQHAMHRVEFYVRMSHVWCS